MKPETTIRDIESEKFLTTLKQDLKLMELMKNGVIARPGCTSASRTENVGEPCEHRTSSAQLLLSLV